MLINLNNNYNFFFKYANQYLECLNIKDTVKYIEIKSITKTDTKKEIKYLFKNKNNKTLFTFIHQAIKGKGTKNKAIPYVSENNKELKHTAIGTLSCISDSFYYFTDDLGFYFPDLTIDQAKYLDFIINNKEYICLLSNRLISNISNQIINTVTDFQKAITNMIKE